MTNSWRLARALEALRVQLNERAPGRSKASDGTIGDAAHATRDSDHNPRVKDAAGMGVVTAIDITHDPEHGCSAQRLADVLVASRDPRIKYCLVPGQRVLCADLTWKPIETLHAGDEVIGFDEWGTRPGTAKGHAGAKMRTSVVEATRRFTLPCYELTTDRGTVVASEDHLWLQARAYQGSYRRWTQTPDYRPGDLIQYFAAPWEPASSFGAGWLAGLFDGEGCLSRATGKGVAGWNLQIAQREGPVLDRAQRMMDAHGIRTAQHQNGAVVGLHVRGGLPEVLRALGTIRTERLTTKAIVDRIWEDHAIAGAWPVAVVQGVRSVGTQEVVAVSTSTRTLVVEGLFSHNCIWNGRIARAYAKPGIPAWTWVPYTGKNPHTKHLHLSVVAEPGGYDDPSGWNLPRERTA